MLQFARNKVVGVERSDQDTLITHGILDDDIYSLKLDVTIRLSDLVILDINGKWNRWTTPECPRAEGFLREVVGLGINSEGFPQKVHKVIGRKACRHFANLLLECCHSAREAAALVGWQDERASRSDLTYQGFLQGRARDDAKPARVQIVSEDGPPGEMKGPGSASRRTGQAFEKHGAGKMIIDLHVHTSPASPCSAVPVEQVIQEAKRIGLDGVCLTDHNYRWDSKQVENLRQRHGYLVLSGNEVTTEQGDMLVFGLEKDIQGVIKLNELRQEVIRSGGFIIVAHPFRGFLVVGVDQVGLTPQDAMKRSLFQMVDAVEVLNSKVTEKENALASKVAQALELPAVGGSDAHEVEEVGLYATSFQAAFQDERGLIEALRGGQYSPVVFRRRD